MSNEPPTEPERRTVGSVSDDSVRDYLRRMLKCDAGVSPLELRERWLTEVEGDQNSSTGGTVVGAAPQRRSRKEDWDLLRLVWSQCLRGELPTLMSRLDVLNESEWADVRPLAAHSRAVLLARCAILEACPPEWSFVLRGHMLQILIRPARESVKDRADLRTRQPFEYGSLKDNQRFFQALPTLLPAIDPRNLELLSRLVLGLLTRSRQAPSGFLHRYSALYPQDAWTRSIFNVARSEIPRGPLRAMQGSVCLLLILALGVIFHKPNPASSGPSTQPAIGPAPSVPSPGSFTQWAPPPANRLAPSTMPSPVSKALLSERLRGLQTDLLVLRTKLETQGMFSRSSFDSDSRRDSYWNSARQDLDEIDQEIEDLLKEPPEGLGQSPEVRSFQQECDRLRKEIDKRREGAKRVKTDEDRWPQTRGPEDLLPRRFRDRVKSYEKSRSPLGDLRLQPGGAPSLEDQLPAFRPPSLKPELPGARGRPSPMQRLEELRSRRVGDPDSPESLISPGSR
jgi:hypothetical protein